MPSSHRYTLILKEESEQDRHIQIIKTFQHKNNTQNPFRQELIVREMQYGRQKCKGALYAHQGCIYLIKNTVQIEI